MQAANDVKSHPYLLTMFACQKILIGLSLIYLPFSVVFRESVKCNGQKMRLYWILVRICVNFHFLASKWHLIASKYPKIAVP